VSLDIDKFYEMVPILRERVKGDAVVGGYGHVGDGNIHINVTVPGYDDHKRAEKVQNLLEPYLLEEVAKRKGSISAEHGVGAAKAEYLGLSKSEQCIDVMFAIKKVLDPNGIMAPYKVFPSHKIAN
jgi:D-2-hydroxyglutarate dehydrogenase